MVTFPRSGQDEEEVKPTASTIDVKGKQAIHSEKKLFLSSVTKLHSGNIGFCRSFTCN